MTLRLHDTATRAVRAFQPVTPGKATVYLVRWLEASGYQVTYCRNVTDIDDKILAVAAAGESPRWALARVRPQELRYYLGQPHYRSTMEYSPDAREDAAAAYQGIERFVTRARRTLGSDPGPAPRLPISFPPRWTTTSACPPPSPPCTRQSATATTL